MLPTSNLMKGLKRQEVQGPLLTDQMRPRTTGCWNSNTYTLSSVLHQPHHSHLHPFLCATPATSLTPTPFPLSYTSRITHTYIPVCPIPATSLTPTHSPLCPTPAMSLTPTLFPLSYTSHITHTYIPMCPTPATSLTPTLSS